MTGRESRPGARLHHWNHPPRCSLPVSPIRPVLPARSADPWERACLRGNDPAHCSHLTLPRDQLPGRADLAAPAVLIHRVTLKVKGAGGRYAALLVLAATWFVAVHLQHYSYLPALRLSI